MQCSLEADNNDSLWDIRFKLGLHWIVRINPIYHKSLSLTSSETQYNYWYIQIEKVEQL